MLFKLSNLNSNLALTLGYLNPALNNSAQESKLAGRTVDCEQSLFFFRFSDGIVRARERRSRETRETRAAARERVSRVFNARWTKKKHTARSLDGP